MGSLGPGLGERGPELIRLRSASKDGDGDLDLVGELSPSGPQQEASGGVCAMGEKFSSLVNRLWSPALPLSNVGSSGSLTLATVPLLGTGDTIPLLLDAGLPLPALSIDGLLFLVASPASFSPHPYSFSFVDTSKRDLLAFKGDGDRL